MAVDLYVTLGVDRAASREEIGKAYRSLARTMHPDKGGEAESWVGIAEAYEVLRDAETRARYDETGELPRRGPSIEDEARQVLLAGFADLVKTGAILSLRDVAGHMRGALGRVRSRCLKEIAGHEAIATQLGSQLGRLAGSEAPFFEAFLNEQISIARQVIEQERHGVTVSDRALGMIADLQDLRSLSEEQAPMKGAFSAIEEFRRKRDEFKYS